LLEELDFPEWLNGLLLLVLASVAASIFALIIRYRRSEGEERNQFRWIVWGAGVFAVGALSLFADLNGEGNLFQAVSLLTGSVMVIALIVAMTKYRLYDIDVVISKTVAYLSLAIVIALLYGTAVVGFILVFGDDSQRGGDLGVLLPIAATALVAIAFEPIRLRLQRWANRLAYGNRAAPYEVISQLTSQLSDTSSGDGLAGLARLLRDGTGAERAVVWLRVGQRLRAEAASPADAIPSPSDIGSEEDLPRSELDLSVPVRHGGETLGAFGITKPHAYPVTPADEDLLSDVGAGAGMLFHNLRLNVELANRAVQLQASRRRLIATQDAARHQLERDLHDGAQQQVIALKVKLGLARVIAERDGADDLAARVTNLADVAQRAIDALRTAAHGIYPPLLETEGLQTALTALRRTGGLTLRIESGDFPRYSRQLEETIYFCVVAAIGRAEMAGGTSAQVTVHGDEAALTVDLSYDSADDGRGLAALTDRVDAFGGTVTIASSANRTTLSLELPVADEIMEPA
jgi:signal transduction histidine kinase